MGREGESEREREGGEEGGRRRRKGRNSHPSVCDLTVDSSLLSFAMQCPGLIVPLTSMPILLKYVLVVLTITLLF